ncbi:MAG TPA: hypothetical protein VFP72_22640 [Kineosporiaceae bacterium]|nr:hypothetical protein [Kineosporiaceae bacterium]
MDDSGMNALDLALGSLALATSTVRRAAITCQNALTPLIRAAARAPLLDPRLAPERFLCDLSERGRVERLATAAHAEALARDLLPRLASFALDQLDLTSIVLNRVNLDAIVATVDLQAILDRVDVDAVVSRADLDPIVARLDLNRIADSIDVDRVAERINLDAVVDRLDILGLAVWIIDSIDLPGIIRESTSSVASEAIRGVRMQSIEADQAVSRVRDRIRPHRRARNAGASAGPANVSMDPGSGTLDAAQPAEPGVRDGDPRP